MFKTALRTSAWLAIAASAAIFEIGPASSRPVFGQGVPAANTASRQADESDADEPKASLSAAMEKVIAAHNRIRIEKKLPPLASNKKLQAAAEVHAKDMAQIEKMAHEGSDGSTVVERVKIQEYRYRRVGENVSCGQMSVKKVMDAWMKSEGHRKNILGDYSQIGSACAIGEDGLPYWCVTFGTPLPASRGPKPREQELSDFDDFPARRPKVDLATVTEKLIEAHNRIRKAEKLSSLSFSKKLQAAAEQQARDMAKSSKMSHEGLDGSTVVERAKMQNYDYRRVGENVAAGHLTIEKVMDGWMKSEPHRHNILGSYSQIGAACAIDEDGKSYWCVTFGLARSR